MGDHLQMNASKLLICLIFAFLLLQTASAYETSGIARIVGDNPEDLINQLDVGDHELNHASYFGDYSNPQTADDTKIIEALFTNYSMEGLYDSEDIWSFAKIKNLNLFSKDQTNTVKIIPTYSH